MEKGLTLILSLREGQALVSPVKGEEFESRFRPKRKGVKGWGKVSPSSSRFEKDKL
jgi:hypothetical protein